MNEEGSMVSMLGEENGESDIDEYGYGYGGQCYACDNYGPIDDMSLCTSCAQKLERDLIRQRAWDYSASAFGLTNELRKKLRNDVIKNYDKDLELIVQPDKKKKKHNKHKHRHKKK